MSDYTFTSNISQPCVGYAYHPSMRVYNGTKRKQSTESHSEGPQQDAHQHPASSKAPEKFRYRTEYISATTGRVRTVTGRVNILDTTTEPPVLEYTDVFQTDDFQGQNELDEKVNVNPPVRARGSSIIKILSPAVNEALRCVVDYFPGVMLHRILGYRTHRCLAAMNVARTIGMPVR